MTENLTVRGFVGADVRLITTEKGLPIATFRMGSTPRRYSRESGEWEDGETNWYSVTCFRQLATNVHAAVRKGDPVVVTGRLRIRPWENQAGQRGINVEIDAEGVGHDLTFGTGSFMRLGTSPAAGGGPSDAPEQAGPDADWGSGGEEQPAAEGDTATDSAATEGAAMPDSAGTDPAWDEAGQKEPAF